MLNRLVAFAVLVVGVFGTATAISLAAGLAWRLQWREAWVAAAAWALVEARCQAADWQQRRASHANSASRS